MSDTSAFAAGERIAVHCDACGRDWRVPANLAGHPGKCACGHVSTVPYAGAPPGTVKCPFCGKWTQPEGLCEWCARPLLRSVLVHLPMMHKSAPAVIAIIAGGVVGGAYAWWMDLHLFHSTMVFLTAGGAAAVIAFRWRRRTLRQVDLVVCCGIICLTAGVLAVNQCCDRSPRVVVVPTVIWAREDYYGNDLILRAWRADQPPEVNLSPPGSAVRLARSGPIELVDRRGALGLEWWEEIRRHEGAAPDASLPPGRLGPLPRK
jgi:hypothetical protein